MKRIIWTIALGLNVVSAGVSLSQGYYELAVFNGFVSGWLAYGLLDAALRVPE
jgi:hypothetical protein